MLPTLWDQVEKLIRLCAYKFYTKYRERCDAAGVEVCDNANDLYQEGFFALLDAVRAYDPAKGYQFITYLNYPLKNRFKAITGGRNRNMPDPLSRSASLDTPVGDDIDVPLVDIIPDEGAEEAFRVTEERMDNDRLREALNRCLSTLPEEQRKLLELRFCDGFTRSKVAETLDLSLSTVEQLEQKGLTALRSTANKKRLFAVMEQDIIDSMGYHASGLNCFKNTWTSSVELACQRVEELRVRMHINT